MILKRVFSLIEMAIRGDTPVHKHLTSYFSGGTMQTDDPFYIERHGADDQLMPYITHPSTLATIQGARQMGKSSLMARTLAYAECQQLKEKLKNK